MTREERNETTIRRRSMAHEKFNLSVTGETETAEGYHSHIIAYDRATMTPAEFAAMYPANTHRKGV